MAPTVAAATTANREATHRLKVAANQLERHLPPQDEPEADDAQVSEAPSTKPSPDEFVLRQCMAAMDKEFDALLDTVCILVPLLDEEGEKNYENHLIEWSDYCEELKERAQEVISIIHAGNVSQVEKIEMSGGHKTVTELANPSDQEVERNKEFKLCDTALPAKNSSVMHQEMHDKMCVEMHDELNDEVYGVMYAEMYAAMSSTVFNRERRTEYNVCKPVFIQQCDANAVKHCRALNLAAQEGGDANGQPVDVGGGPGEGGGGGAAPPAEVKPTGEDQRDSLTSPPIQISQGLTPPTVTTTSAQSSYTSTSTASAPVPAPAPSTAAVMGGGSNRATLTPT